ncbi:MAG: hypothetical protein ACRCU9_01780, partial [Iodobacter sp.]
MKYALSLALCVMAGTAFAESASVGIDLIDDKGVVKPAGVVLYEDTPYGLLLTPQLNGIPAGLHGFHIHDKAACGPAEVDGKVVT